MSLSLGRCREQCDRRIIASWRRIFRCAAGRIARCGGISPLGSAGGERERVVAVGADVDARKE